MKPPLRLLLVDDDEDDRSFFAGAVHEIDPAIECIIAPEGTTGIKYLSEPANLLPDYIFLDLRMPGMSGRTFLKLVKDDLRLRKIPIIIYTTSNDEMDSEELINMGATHFTTKPSNPEEIYYVLSMILSEEW